MASTSRSIAATTRQEGTTQTEKTRATRFGSLAPSSAKPYRACPIWPAQESRLYLYGSRYDIAHKCASWRSDAFPSPSSARDRDFHLELRSSIPSLRPSPRRCCLPSGTTAILICVARGKRNFCPAVVKERWVLCRWRFDHREVIRAPFVFVLTSGSLQARPVRSRNAKTSLQRSQPPARNHSRTGRRIDRSSPGNQRAERG